MASFTREDIEKLISDSEECGNMVETLKPIYTDWRLKRLRVIKILLSMADQLEKHQRDKHICTITGSSAGIAGCIISIIGIALAPFTAGASLIVSGVGVGVGASGGAVSAGGAIGEAAHTKSLKKNLEKFLSEERKSLDVMSTKLQTIFEFIGDTELLNRLHYVVYELHKSVVGDSKWTPAWKQKLSNTTTGEVVLKSLVPLRLLGVGADIAEAAIKPVSSLARVGFRALAGGLNVLFVGVDIAFLYTAIRDWNDVSKTKRIREDVKKMKAELDEMDSVYKALDPDAVIKIVQEKIDQSDEEESEGFMDPSDTDFFKKMASILKEETATQNMSMI